MKIKIRWWDGREFSDLEVDAAPCGVPGLAVHAAPGASGWVITHTATGCRAAWFPDADPEWVLACAQALGGLGDWTAFPGPQLAANTLVVLGEFGASSAPPPVPPDVLSAERARILAAAFGA